ncbi:hypothetical protein TREPR_0992 [Treponema primitia ZAS-2]|uniref:Uncharacterized protein n=1 Tax=Treponema primitia (strain ATCC BAA-887 / DSM 12427 / ZAS-2) TaxID=545694 RepID=F5YHT0_TREPZ|nr:hypothetical protein TREPR_0992 [Treponema primitia ZAS-2]
MAVVGNRPWGSFPGFHHGNRGFFCTLSKSQFMIIAIISY